MQGRCNAPSLLVVCVRDIIFACVVVSVKGAPGQGPLRQPAAYISISHQLLPLSIPSGRAMQPSAWERQSRRHWRPAAEQSINAVAIAACLAVAGWGLPAALAAGVAGASLLDLLPMHWARGSGGLLVLGSARRTDGVCIGLPCMQPSESTGASAFTDLHPWAPFAKSETATPLRELDGRACRAPAFHICHRLGIANRCMPCAMQEPQAKPNPVTCGYGCPSAWHLRARAAQRRDDATSAAARLGPH